MTGSTTRLLLAGLAAACCAEIAQAQTATATLAPTRSVIVHKDADDYRTQPTGNSGARVACGIIKKA